MLIFGSQGWHQVGGQTLKTGWADFYPVDMPQDWRLDFYTSFFDCLLLGQSDWQDASSEWLSMVAESLEDEAFDWVLSVDDYSDQALDRLQILLEQPGFERVQLLCWSPEPTWLERLPALVKVTIGLKKPLDMDQVKAQWQPFLAGSDWDWCTQESCLIGWPLGYWPTLPDDPKQQAGWLQTFAATLPEALSQERVACVAGEGVSAKTLRELKVMADVLGLT
ncbi:MAG: hypothetical protein RI556_02115 [Hydrogenovibrio sp.]|uniref:hypothetical protein n=1 Tax=Hydrogenovibrio sp. TaxID=2065821 RepID=UPI00286FE533|nr:hypothetical protein [Hydrogenovibrio sp.]MDR9497945.1 hypothetical protein [Hydrogenovibrio sp.]